MVHAAIELQERDSQFRVLLSYWGIAFRNGSWQRSIGIPSNTNGKSPHRHIWEPIRIVELTRIHKLFMSY